MVEGHKLSEDLLDPKHMLEVCRDFELGKAHKVPIYGHGKHGPPVGDLCLPGTVG